MRVLFSIIIPTYNAEKSLGALLQKLNALVDNYSKEIIIIDSQSQDKTIQIAKQYVDDRIPLKIIKIKKADFNHAETRNLGARLAKGKYVCYFSQDALPKSLQILKYYHEDFKSEKKLVAIFGKHIPYEDTPVIQKIEILCRFEKLDRFINRQGVLFQNLAKPFIAHSKKNLGLWYALSNTSACYKKYFLLTHPFPKTDYGEDLLLGKTIIENRFVKVYDARCAVFHSHRFDLWQYFLREKEDLNLRVNRLKLYQSVNVLCKIKKIFKLKISLIKKIYYLFLLFIYYFLKLIALFVLLFKRL